MIKEIDDANGNYATKDIKELILVFDSGLFVCGTAFNDIYRENFDEKER